MKWDLCFNTAGSRLQTSFGRSPKSQEIRRVFPQRRSAGQKKGSFRRVRSGVRSGLEWFAVLCQRSQTKLANIGLTEGIVTTAIVPISPD